MECAEEGRKAAFQYSKTRTSDKLGMRGWLLEENAVFDSAYDAGRQH